MASIMYWLQVGVNRQLGAFNGLKIVWYARINPINKPVKTRRNGFLPRLLSVDEKR
jgi:hypothetical protein